MFGPLPICNSVLVEYALDFFDVGGLAEGQPKQLAGLLAVEVVSRYDSPLASPLVLHDSAAPFAIALDKHDTFLPAVLNRLTEAAAIHEHDALRSFGYKG